MNITIYTTDTCPYSKLAKEWMDRNGLEYTEKDAGNDAKAANEMVNVSHQLGVPTIVADGQVIIGYNERLLEAYLGGNHADGGTHAP